MSGIGAACRWDGGPIDGTINAMAAALRPLALDGLETWIDVNCGLTHAHLWTVPEDVGSKQPASNAAGNLHIVADARLDNREDLLRRLGEAVRAEVPTDSEIILAAYERWGDSCPAKLLGDFAFVVWDSLAKRVFAARDVLGVRPLFYCYRGNRVVLATTIPAVASGDGGRFALNRDVVSAVAVGRRDRWDRETVWTDLRRLPPAHSLHIEAGKEPILRRYYAMGQERLPVRRTLDDWREEFGSVFCESVRARLRSQSKVIVLGGGGLDSAAVFSQAAHLAISTSVRADISLLSATFNNTPGADEREYLAALRERWPTFAVSELLCDDCIADPADDEMDDGLREPNMWPIPALMRSLVAESARLGARVVLGGECGDIVLYSDYGSPRMLNDLPLRSRLRELRHYRFGVRTSLAVLLGGVRGRLRRLMTPANLRLPILPTWAGEVSRAELNVWSAQGLSDRLAVAGAQAGIELRHPFADRRLVDLMLMAPMNARCDRGTDKLLLRRALRGILPDAVVDRRTKAYFDHLAVEGLRRHRQQVDDFVRTSVLGELRLVDMARIRSQWNQFLADPSNAVAAKILWFCSTERWIRRGRQLP